MYRWRQLNEAERREILQWRRHRGCPIHSPRHLDGGDTWYHLTAACYEHSAHIGRTPERVAEFTEDLLTVLGTKVAAWVVLPNHYHTLVRTANVLALLDRLGKLHGRSSFAWNGEEETRGRRVWCKTAETAMKGDRHFHATVN